MKHNISQKPYLVKSSLTWRDLVLRCMQNCSLRYTLHVDYGVKGTSQNPGTWQNILEICDTRWWVKTTIWVPRKLAVCSPWFLRCSLDEVCGEWNATYLKNQHVTKFFLFGDMQCILMGEIKIYDPFPQMGMFAIHVLFHLSCDACTTTWWILFLRYVYRLGQVCHGRNATYLKNHTQSSHHWHGRTWFWGACRIALWDICCTLTTMWREHLKIQARDKIFWRYVTHVGGEMKTTIWVCKKLVVCSTWFLGCGLGEVCHGRNTTYLKNRT